MVNTPPVLRLLSTPEVEFGYKPDELDAETCIPDDAGPSCTEVDPVTPAVIVCVVLDVTTTTPPVLRLLSALKVELGYKTGELDAEFDTADEAVPSCAEVDPVLPAVKVDVVLDVVTTVLPTWLAVLDKLPVAPCAVDDTIAEL